MKLSSVGFCLLSIDAITCALAVISCTGTILLSSRSGSSAAVHQNTSLLVREGCVVIDLALYSIVQCGQGCKPSLSLSLVFHVQRFATNLRFATNVTVWQRHCRLFPVVGVIQIVVITDLIQCRDTMQNQLIYACNYCACGRSRLSWPMHSVNHLALSCSTELHTRCLCCHKCTL